MAAVLGLSGDERFAHFIKIIADREEVWGLYHKGWALASTDDGATVFPLWPAKEYAQLCAVNEWQEFLPRSIGLSDFVDALLPKLKADGVLPGVFYTPTGRGVTPTVDELMSALHAELAKY